MRAHGQMSRRKASEASLSLNRRRRQHRARSGGYHSPVKVGADGNDSDNRVRCDMGAKLLVMAYLLYGTPRN